MPSQADGFGKPVLNAPFYGPSQPRKTFVLCFDGTGNKFSGTAGDSNILKIFRMLDRNDPNQLHYYQPGIGTYVQSNSYSHTSVFTRFNSWLQKTRDSAIGSSFDEHVMGGYKFLMRYYAAGDDIYIFGFSRGAYIARFLAEMLDYVGLLTAGNEEMARFAWKAFANWQRRLEGSKEEEVKKKEMFRFLQAFRDTFSRPVRRIRFLGLFDTVNSVPRFENRWMERSKFPYTAHSSALVIRHAVGIDERRAKFRQDLISETKPVHSHPHSHFRPDPRGQPADRIDHFGAHLGTESERVVVPTPQQPAAQSDRFRRTSDAHRRSIANRYERSRSRERRRPLEAVQEGDARSINSVSSNASAQNPRAVAGDDDDADDENIPQDIQEIWFPGCHADIGGGWMPDAGEVSLSHGPLCWIVREAQKAGLRFDYEKMLELNCSDEDYDDSSIAPDDLGTRPSLPRGPEIRIVDVGSPVENPNPTSDKSSSEPEQEQKQKQNPTNLRPFHDRLHKSATQGRLHDCLKFDNGLPAGSVLSWRLMEYLPFRRMDLQLDNSWKSIRWPLPGGEVRDIPAGAVIHNSAIKRMDHNPDYRPGNLIIGGGGRGVRVAPTHFGTGKWQVLREHGDLVGECYIRQVLEPVEKVNGKE